MKSDRLAALVTAASQAPVLLGIAEIELDLETQIAHHFLLRGSAAGGIAISAL